MMADRSVSWTDAERVALLLRQVSSPRPPVPRNPQKNVAIPTGASSGAVRPVTGIPAPPLPTANVTRSSSPAPLPSAAPPLPSAAPPAIAAGAVPVISAGAPARAKAQNIASAAHEAVAVPRLQQTSDNPSDRLDALVAWTLDHYRCTGAFVADDNGLTLAAHGISEAHVSLVGPLFSALIGIRSIPGIDGTAGALWLGANMMSWVETRTERGGFCLGAVGPEALPTRALEQLKEALEITVRGL
ncbi:MAG TPA: hypothetical protein VFQ61_03580 [Polyangiaceae bacterium]|nr:hypothetical protein [Polyangiaceae bacterium]